MRHGSLSKALYSTLEDLEGMLKSGMEEGATETIVRFAELLKTKVGE